MKRTTIILSLIFALAIALSVSVPTLAATIGETDVSGTVPAILDVAAPWDIADIDLDPEATQPVPGSSGTAGNVKSNQLWTLTVKDNTNGGYLMDGTNAMENKLQINAASDGWADADTGNSIDGGRGANNPISFAVRQGVTWDDEPGEYSITITFAVTTR